MAGRTLSIGEATKQEDAKFDLRSSAEMQDKRSEVQYCANLTTFLSIRCMKHKEHHMSTQSVTHAPELIFIHVVQGQHMTSELIMRLSGAEIFCCSYGKGCLTTGISICSCLGRPHKSGSCIADLCI